MQNHVEHFGRKVFWKILLKNWLKELRKKIVWKEWVNTIFKELMIVWKNWITNLGDKINVIFFLKKLDIKFVEITGLTNLVGK